MGQFDIDEALKPRKTVMLLIGTWPKEDPNLMYRLKGLFTMFLLFSFSVTIMIEVIIDSSNLEEASYGISIALIAIHALAKHIMVYSNKSRFFKIVKSLRQPILAKHDDYLDIFLQNKVRLCNIWPPILLYGSLMVVVLTIVPPIFRENRLLPLPFPMNMMEQHYLVYLAIYIYQCVTGVLLGCTVPCYDGVNFTFIAIAAGQLRVIREKIIRAADCIPSTTSLKQQEIKINKILKNCIQHHIVIERYMVELQKIFSLGFVVQLLLSVLVHCFTGLSLLFLPVMSIAFLRGVFLLAASFIELLFYCVAGNEIILQSQMIRDACYMCEWTELSTSNRKTLLMIMEKSKRPFKLTAANLTELSIATFVGVLQKSFSYFTVLRGLYGSSNKP